MGVFTDQSLQQIKEAFPKLKFRPKVPLAKITYFKIGGPAEVLVKAGERGQLVSLLQYCRSHDLPFTILGGASNVIVSDKGIEGLIILARHEELSVEKQEQDETVLQVDSGIRTSTLVSKSVKLGLQGLEPFLGVPGRLGGAIYNNSHFHEELIGNFVTQVEVFNDKNDVVWIDQDECDFDYDHSRFQSTHEVILRVNFKLAKGDPAASQSKIKETTLYRIKTQPLGLPSSGCIFKNVPNSEHLRELFPQFKDKEHISAGFLIDQAGLKGLREGEIEVSQKHAAFMVNLGKGTAEDVKKLISKVKDKVKQEFNVQLQEEVFWLGE